MRHSELVVLGLLIREPKHGYELRQMLEQMHINQWAKLGASTVYSTLTRLERGGFVRQKASREGRRPERSVYHVTDSGREEFRRQVKEAIGSSAPVFSDRVVGSMMGGWCLPNEEVRGLLEPDRERLRAGAEVMQVSLDGELPADSRPILEYYRKMVRAEVDFFDAVMELYAGEAEDS